MLPKIETEWKKVYKFKILPTTKKLRTKSVTGREGNILFFFGFKLFKDNIACIYFGVTLHSHKILLTPN